MNTTDHNTRSIERKLNVIISLLLRIANSGSDLTLREQIRNLASFGLSSSEIAEIVGKKVGYVSKELSILKREAT
jgi:DNA-binding CsgD family transcriptional regulator